MQKKFYLCHAAGKIFLAIFFSLLCFEAVAQAERQQISASFANEPLTEVLKTLENLSDYRFIFNYADVEPYNITVVLRNVEMRIALSRIFMGMPFEYTIEGNRITVRKITQQPTDGRMVSGRVTNTGGSALAGVNVLIGTTGRGTMTDLDGNYSVAASPIDTLIFSYIGYRTQTVVAGRRTTINIRMEIEVQRIGDVIVTGYQTISAERATGAYTIVDREQLDKKFTDNIANALNGLVPGMATVSSTLEGQDRFVIRGKGTMQTGLIDTDPLIVVDGFPIQGYTPSSLGGDGLINSKDPFTTINPNDVESVTVLKDAAATSIYGARAANGVIVITTKKGRKSDKVEVSASGFFSISSKPDLDYAFNMASTESTVWYMEHLQKYYPSYKTYDPYKYPTYPFLYTINDVGQLVWEYYMKGNLTEAQYNEKVAELIGRGDKWKEDINKLVNRNALHQQYNIALRGGTDVMNYSLSVSYDNENYTEIGNDSRRMIINSVNNFKISKRLTLDIGINASIIEKDNNGVSYATLAGCMGSWSQLVDENGDYVHMPQYYYSMYYPIMVTYEDISPVSWLYNPLQDQENTDFTSERFNTRFNAGLNYKIIEGLNVSVKGQYERNKYTTHYYFGTDSYKVRYYVNYYSTLNEETGKYESYFPSGGIIYDAGDTYTGYNLRGQIDYQKSWGRHEFTAIAGTEVLSSTHENDPGIWRYGYNENTNAVLGALDYVTTDNPTFFGTTTSMPYAAPEGLITIEDRFFSVYANAAYTLDGKYTLSASFRTDASNYLAETIREKFSPFWSVGASWLISRENFMREVNWVDFLKLRASVGEAGFAAGKSKTSSISTVAVNSGSITYTNNEPYNTISSRGNPTLTWEKSRSFDVGFETSLWNGKLNATISYYRKYSYDVLSSATVAMYAQGASTATFNNAAISNNGIEVALGSNLEITPGLVWSGQLNFSYNKNTVLDYSVINTYLRPTTYVGYPMGCIWVYKIAGYTDEGYVRLLGKDGKEEIVKDRDTSHLYDQINGAAGDKVEDNNWVYYLGSPTPSTNLGFTSTFMYKGFTFSFQITGKFDYYFKRTDAYVFVPLNASFAASLDEAIAIYEQGYSYNTPYVGVPLWTEENKDVHASGSVFSSLNTISQASSYYYLKGDHLRLNEVYLGYDVPQRFLNKLGLVRKLNIFAQVQNLGLIWSANKIMDPDYPAGNGYTPTATFLFGIKLNFN